MDLTELENQLGISFRNPELFRQAFTHTSFAHERRDETDLAHNERLEFLGDAVLELLVSEHLFHRYPGKNEGDLTRMRARVVCEPSLAQFAEELGFGRLVRLGKGEEMTGGRRRPALLADLFEAFVGALYLDQGLDRARQFLQRFVFSRIDEDWLSRIIDAKTRLQELVQQERTGSLTYRIVDEWGPAHDRHFVAEVHLDGRRLGRGTGRSKKEAEQEAAAMALRELEDRP
jgi:ribonuclease III